MATNKFAKVCLAASALFMATSIFGTLSDPTLDLNSSTSFLEPFVEKDQQRVVLEDARYSRRLQEQGRRRLRAATSTSKTTSDSEESSSSSLTSSNIDIRSISDQVSKMIAKDVASMISDVVKKSLSSEETSHEDNTEPPSAPTASSPAASSKPVKVFILMGQSNMVGQGEVYGDYDGTLEYAIHKKNKYQHLIDPASSPTNNNDNTTSNATAWAYKKDVRYAFINSDKGGFSVKRNDWLSVEGPRNKLGPEIEIGWILGDQYPDEPILLLKACTGHRSLGWDLLPPGSKRYEKNGEIYAGYHDLEPKWKKGEEPKKTEDLEAMLKDQKAWYGGKQYDIDVHNAKKVLEKLPNFYPGAKSSYEISGFFYWQGEKDRRTDEHVERYEENLVQLIRSVRNEFNASEAPFVVSSVGFDGDKMEGRTQKVYQAQMAVDGNRRKYKDFEGNVKAVDSRNIWREEMSSGSQAEHYGYNAEAYMEVGIMMGWSMVQLLKQL